MDDDYNDIIRELESVRAELEESDNSQESLISRRKELHAELKSLFGENNSKDISDITVELDDIIKDIESTTIEDKSEEDLYIFLVAIRTLRNDLERKDPSHELIERSVDFEERISDEIYRSQS